MGFGERRIILSCLKKEYLVTNGKRRLLCFEILAIFVDNLACGHIVFCNSLDYLEIIMP